MSLPSISIVFPMFNEVDWVDQTMSKTLEVLEKMTPDFEVIVVDDASCDGSSELVDAWAEKDSRIKVMRHEINRKLGGSLKTGFQNATKEIVVYSDIDNPFDLREISTGISLLQKENAQIVSAYRNNEASEGLRRYIYHVGYNWFIRLFFGLKIRDVNFAFKIFKNDYLKTKNYFSEGSFIDAEILITAKRDGAKIAQFGTEYFPRLVGLAKLDSISVIFKILQEAFLFRFKQNKKTEKDTHEQDIYQCG